MRQKPTPVRASVPPDSPVTATKATPVAATPAAPAKEALATLVTSVAAALDDLQSQIVAMTQRQRLVGRDFGLLVKLMSVENRRLLRLTRRARKIVRRSRWRCRHPMTPKGEAGAIPA